VREAHPERLECRLWVEDELAFRILTMRQSDRRSSRSRAMSSAISCCVRLTTAEIYRICA